MTGLRETHKQSTRRALEDAALTRFARDGYDETSVEAIAAGAGVSTRTFFRYFATKDEVLAMGREQRQAELRSTIRELAPVAGSDLAVVRGAILSLAAGFEDDRERVALRQQAVERSTMLRGRLFDAFVSWERMIAHELGGGARAEVLAVVGIAIFRASTAVWLADGGSLRELVDRGFEALG